VKPRLTRVLTLVVTVALAITGLLAVTGTAAPRKHLTADFASTISLYTGANVDILGVPIGHVTSVKVDGTHVRVQISYPAKYRLPADVHAVIVPPSIVGDRFIQLTPAYTRGPVLADEAHLTEDRTDVPLELDQTYQTLDKLAQALGPDGANKNGALSHLITAAHSALAGNGPDLNAALHQLAGAADTLAAGSSDFTSTVTSLSKISETLAADDPQVRALVANLATVAAQLNAQRTNLAAATSGLSGALADVSAFVKANKAGITTDLAGLSTISKTLAQHQRDLAEILDVAPLGVTNLYYTSQPENFDSAHPNAVAADGRTYATAARADLFNDLTTQLGFTVSALCGTLPAEQAKILAPLCTALQHAGDLLGQVLERLLGGAGGGLLASGHSATTLAGLLTGASQ